MTRAFIVKLDLSEEDLQFLGGISEDIAEELGAAGYEVVSVAPYAEPESSTDSGGMDLSALGLLQPPPTDAPLF